MRKTLSAIYFTPIFILILFILPCNTASAQLDTADVRRLMQEGIIRLQNKEIRQAIEVFDQGREMLHKIAIDMDERNQSLIRSNELTRQAERLIQQGNLDGALELLNEAIVLNDQNVEAYKFRGSIRLIMEQNIDRPRDRDYIGLINDYTNAVRIVDRKIGTTPRNSQERKELEKERAKILINRAYVKMQSNRSPGFYSAIDDYTDAIRNDDQNWDGFLGRAVAYNKIREYRREVNDYLKAIELMQKYEYRMSDQDWGQLYLTVANAYANLRDRRNAYDYATRAYNLGNLDAERLMNRNRP